jgi:hypothetical protein
MPCCSGHSCDMCATCKLGVCCGDSGYHPTEPHGVPIGEPQRRTSPVEVPTMPVRTPARVG